MVETSSDAKVNISVSNADITTSKYCGAHIEVALILYIIISSSRALYV